MFRNATAFNGDISSWIVDNVRDMSNMFNGAMAFNRNITSWRVGEGTNVTDMFKNATAFHARFVCDDVDDGPLNTCAVGNDCDASEPPVNGGVGDCTDSLPSGFTCQPTCNTGYTVSGTSSCSAGTLTAATCKPLQLSDLNLPALTHWFDFSRMSDSSIDSVVSSDISDLKANATDIEVVGTVQFEPSIQNGLGAVYFDKPPTTSRTVRFRSSLLGRNPEVFVVFRVLSYSDNGVVIGDVGNGYGFGTYKAGDGAVTVCRSSGTCMVKVAANYSVWHLAHLYFGENEGDGFLQLDAGERYYFGISGKYLTSEHSRPEMGAFSGDRFDHMVEQYVGKWLTSQTLSLKNNERV
jgi:surface protein